jgi:hypothetical protein
VTNGFWGEFFLKIDFVPAFLRECDVTRFVTRFLKIDSVPAFLRGT